MFPFSKRQRPKANTAGYAEEWRRLRDDLADPAVELAKTKQALIVSAASVLDRLWNGHGGIGWDESCEADYIAPLREHLISSDVFSVEECGVIGQKLDEIVAVGRRNSQAADEAGDGETVLESACAEVDYIVLRAVDWCRHFPEPIPTGDTEEYHGHF